MEFYMGQALGQPELPAGSVRPDQTPAEGVIVVDNDPDGFVRRYLYKAINGETSEVLISETPNEALIQASELVDAAPPAPGMGQTQIPFKSNGALPVQKTPTLGEARPMKVAGASIMTQAATKLQPSHQAEVNSPLLQLHSAPSPSLGEAKLKGSPTISEVVQKAAPVPVDDTVVRDQRPLQTMRPAIGGPTTFLENSVKVMMPSEPALGNVPQKQAVMGSAMPLMGHAPVSLGQSAPPASAPPAEPAPAPGTCPGAVEMPDGRVIEPEDGIKLQDLCELMPFLLESYAAIQAKQANGKVAPGQSVPVRGQAPGGPGGVPTASQFGPAGAVGGGGGGFGGGGGGPGPVGPRGNQGPVGPVGFGGLVDAVTKTDGDFSAGPGAFIPVPDTSIMFMQGVSGPAIFLLNASPGLTSGAGGSSQSGQIGVRIDGVDYPLATRVLHTFVGGVGEFILGQSVFHIEPMLAAGMHTAEVVIRGLAPGEIGGASLGIPFAVAATSTQPLQFSVVHN
jgi:hypothetical protein